MKKTISILCAVALIFITAVPAAAGLDTIASSLKSRIDFEYGDEWSVIALQHAGALASVQKSTYYSNIKSLVKKQKGWLSDSKYTEYSRVILALNSIGESVSDVSGYSLVKRLFDYGNVTKQGVNGAIYALLALDSGNYKITGGDATRRKYVTYILNSALANGGISMGGNSADVDITSAAICALAKYRDQRNVQACVDKAVNYLVSVQNSDGSFSNSGVQNCESTAQAMIAFIQLGYGNGSACKAAVNALYRFKNASGGFFHKEGDAVSTMSATQALMALSCTVNGAIYKKYPFYSRKSFSDVDTYAIDALSARGIASGSYGKFYPYSHITRAEFCALCTRMLDISSDKSVPLSDISRKAWYFESVSAMYNAGYVSGVSLTHFSPDGEITLEQEIIIAERIAKDKNFSVSAIPYSKSKTAATRFESAVIIYTIMDLGGLL